MFLDDSACNLASLNLRKFQRTTGRRRRARRRGVPPRAARPRSRRWRSSSTTRAYPTEQIAENSYAFRPLGLGFANLGALLMSRSLPYDSEPGRAYAAAITALMCGEAYRTSAQIAADATGPFAGYAENETPFLRVMRKHRASRRAHRRRARPVRPHAGGARVVGRGDRARPEVRLPQRPDHGPRADRHDRVPDGLRHHRRRARHRDRQVQAPRRRRPPQDRQPHRPRGARASLGYTDKRGRGDHRAHRREGHDRGRAAPQGRAPAGLRLRVPLVERHPLDPLHGPHPHDGGGPAVPLGRDLEDGQPPDRLHRRGHRGRVHPGLEDGPQGDRGLPRRLQAHAAAVDEPEAGDVERLGRQHRRSPRSLATNVDPLDLLAPEERRLVEALRAPQVAPGRSADGEPLQAARRARVVHAQVLDRRPRGLHHRRPVRGRHRRARSSSAWRRRAR